MKRWCDTLIWLLGEGEGGVGVVSEFEKSEEVDETDLQPNVL